MSAKNIYNPEFMQEAINEAEKAREINEVPIGCIIVNTETNQIIARAHNTVESNQNPLLHAEVVAIQRANEILGNKFLNKCALYTTLEPCPMCATAISFARIPTIFVASEDKKGGAVFNNIKIYENQPNLFKPTPILITDDLSEKASSMLSNFFKKLRISKK